MTTPAIDRARAFSDARLALLRARIPALVPAGTAVVACGSYARREASDASDFDYFVILPASSTPAEEPRRWETPLKQALAGIVGVEPAKDGAFGRTETRDGIVRNIGGQADDNQKLTRRMLFLLEGAPLSFEAEARQVRRDILRRYVEAGRQTPLASFLLNDIIRYYRTIAVDYEFKTTEGDRPKPWGLRNVKLMFSRKLLYAAGLFSVADASGGTAETRLARLETLLDLCPIDRLTEICGPERLRSMLAIYDRFLSRLADPETRRQLEALRLADQEQALFRSFEVEGELFGRQILAAFRATFGPAHPIHRALVL